MSAAQACPVCRGQRGQHKFTCPERLGGDRVILRARVATPDAEEIARLTRLLAERDATIARLRLARAGHPVCEAHPEGEGITCGWKRVVADMDAALAKPRPVDPLVDLAARLEPLLVTWRAATPPAEPRKPAEYAALAALYAQIDAAGDPRPTTKLARMLDASPVSLAGRIHEARVLGLLTPTRHGISGGALTDQARAVLDKALEETDA